MAINRSDIVNQLKKSFPNILKRDLEKLISIVLNEIKKALKRTDSVELRTWNYTDFIKSTGSINMPKRVHSSFSCFKNYQK